MIGFNKNPLLLYFCIYQHKINLDYGRYINIRRALFTERRTSWL